jgi:ATP-dependent DNA helicase RecG
VIKFKRLLSAFANADGGEFIIGIKDKKDEPAISKRWQGIGDKESFNQVFQNIADISPSIPHDIEFLKDAAGKYALRIIIEKSDSVHKTSDNTVYIRSSAQSLKLKDPFKIQELSYAKGESSYEDAIVNNATAEDIFESIEVKSFLEDYSQNSDPIDFTINQNLVDRKTFDPRTAGILLFSDNPIPILPKRCGIKISRYDTELNIPDREHLKKQNTIEGCLYRQIQEAVKIITEIIESIKVRSSEGLVKAKYPQETIWEILVNAVIHRDYSISDDIQIHIFNNRVEVISPGRLPGYVTVENILEARFSRNSKIVRILNKYKEAPNKDMGEGLNTAFQKMEEVRPKPPVIKEEGNYVKVIIAHTPLASPEEAVLEYLNQNCQIKNGEARAITGIKSENVMSKTGSRVIAWTMKNKNVNS